MSNDRGGVYGVSRSIWDDPDFANEPFTEREAWLWLIGAAAWKPARSRGNHGHAIDLYRGEFSFSVRFLAEKWRWSKSAVDRFFNKLEKRDMLSSTERDSAKVYFVTNYNKFQVVGVPDRDTDRDVGRDSSGTAAGQRRNIEEGKKERKDNSSLRSLSHSSENDLFGKAGEGTGNQLVPIAKPAAEPQGEHARFVEFWQTYPKRLGTNSRKEASAKFTRAVKAGADPTAIIAGAARYAAHCDETGKTSTDKVQQATTWLNQANWETDYGRQQLNTRQQSNGRPIQGNPVLANAITRLEERRLRFTDPETGSYDARAADAFGEIERDRMRAQFYPNTFGRG